MKTNLSFLIILFVAVVTFINDIIIYFFKLDYLLSLIISTVAVMGLLIFLLKKKKIEIENYFCKWDLIFLGLFLVFTIIKIVTPDFNYDSVNYHYYNQKYPFVDKMKFDFFVAGSGGGVLDFVYPIADRMNFIFRYFLGMRLGTILSFFAVIVIFYEIKKIIKLLVPNIKPSIQIFCASFPISIPILFRFIGTYYIDIYSTVFLLELLYIALKEKELIKKKILLYYWFFISGIAVGIKISNLVLIIPVGIYIIINNYKQLKNLRIRDYVISIVLFFLPFAIYGLNNYIQMGNFFYPFFGMKKFYPTKVWNDPKFGIPNFWYSFIWPIYITFFPKSGHNENVIELIWAFGYVILIINIITKLINKDLKNVVFRFEVIIFIYCILWSVFLNGYSRYAMIIPILFAMDITINFGLNIKGENKINRVFYGLQFIPLIFIFVVTLYGTKSEMLYSIRCFKTEIKNVFIDKNYTIHIDGVWGCIGDIGGMESLVREESTPIYNLENENVKKSEILYGKYKNNVSNKDIYVIVPNNYRSKEEIFNLLKEEKFEVIEKAEEYDYTDEIPYIIYKDKWEIYKVRYLGEV